MKNIKSALLILSTFILIIFSSFLVSMFSDDAKTVGGRIHLHKPVHIPVESIDLKDNTLLFFGYVGCEDVCTPRMNEVQSIYKEYKEKSGLNNLDVLFISLKSDESEELIDSYVKAFDKDFIGLKVPKKSLLKLTRTFNAYYSKSFTGDDVINHTEFLYLIKKNMDSTFYLKNIYMQTPYNQQMIVNDLIKDE